MSQMGNRKGRKLDLLTYTGVNVSILLIRNCQVMYDKRKEIIYEVRGLSFNMFFRVSLITGMTTATRL